MNHADFEPGKVYLLRLKSGLCLFGVLEWTLPQHNVGYIGGIMRSFQTGLVNFDDIVGWSVFARYTSLETEVEWTERIGLRGIFERF